jgi:hypothetical protein
MVNQLPTGATLYQSAILAAALSVTGVRPSPASIQINGMAKDLAGTPDQETKTTVASITVTEY